MSRSAVLAVAVAVLSAVLCTAPSPARAQVQTITITHTYVVGDNDSRNDARQLCFLEAKRKVLEKAGSAVQASSEVQNFQLTKDQIRSYSAAVLSVETVKEEFGFSNGHTTLTLVVKADLDMADVQKRLAEIVSDKSLQARVMGQQQQLQRLEEQVRQLSSNLRTSPLVSSGELRKERNVAIGDIQELEALKLKAIKRIANEAAALKELERQVRERIQYIVVGMTQEEVAAILGERTDEYMPKPPKTHYLAWEYGHAMKVCFGVYSDGPHKITFKVARVVYYSQSCENN